MVGNQGLQSLCPDSRGIRAQMQAGIGDRRIGEKLFQRLVVLEVLVSFSLGDLVQRGLGDEQVASLDQLAHLAEEKSEQQGADVRTIDVGVRHDHYGVVTELVRVEFARADTTSQRGDEGAHLGTRQHLVEPGLFNVENLALEGQDRLGATIASLFGRTTGRIPFDEEELRRGRVLFLAVGELAGQAGQIQGTFASGHFPSAPCRFPGPRGIDDLADDGLGLGGMLEQIIAEGPGHFLFHRGLDFGADQFVLGLGREFGVRHLDRDDGGEPLASVVSGRRDLGLGQHPLALHVIVQRSGERSPEAREVGAPIPLGDIVGVGEDVFLITVIPLQRYFDTDSVFTLAIEMNHAVERRPVLVEKIDKGTQPAVILKNVRLAAALVGQGDANTGIQERQLPQPVGKNFVMKGDVAEGFRRWPESHFGSRGLYGFPDHCQGRLRYAVTVDLFVHLAITTNRQVELFR